MNDPTMQDVRAGNAVYDPTVDGFVWLPGKDPSQFSPGTITATPAQSVWDSGVGSEVVTVSASAKPSDHSLVWLLLAAAGVAWLVLED